MKTINTAANVQTRRQRLKEWVSLPGGFGIITGISMFLTIVLIGVIHPFISAYEPDEFVGE